jgi:hypothetical protein
MSGQTEQKKHTMTNRQALNKTLLQQHVVQERLKDACRKEVRDYEWAVRLADKLALPLKCLEIARALHEIDLEVTRLGFANPNEEYDPRYLDGGKQSTVSADAQVGEEDSGEANRSE